MKRSFVLAYKEIRRNPITTLYSVFLNCCMIVIIQLISAVIYSTVLKNKIEHANNNSLLVICILVIIWVALILFLTIVYKLMKYKNRRNYAIYYTLGMKKREIENIIIYKSIFFAFFSVVISSLIVSVLLWGIFPGILHIRNLRFSISFFLVNEGVCFIITIMIGIFSDKKNICTTSHLFRNKQMTINGKLSFKLTEKHSGKSKYPFFLGVKKMFQDTTGTIILGVPIMFLLIFFIRFSYYAEETWLIGNWKSGWDCNYVVSVENTKNNISDKFLKELKQISEINYYEQWEIPTYTENMDLLHYLECKIEKESVTEIGKKQLSLSSNIEKGNDNKYYYIATNFFGYDKNGLRKLKKYLLEGEIDIEAMQRENIILLPKNINWSDKWNIPYTNLKIGDTITLTVQDENRNDEIMIKCVVGGFLSEIPLPNTTIVSNGFGVVMSKERLQAMKIYKTGIKHISIFARKEKKLQNKLEELCEKYGYNFTKKIITQRKGTEMGILLFRTIFIILCITLFTLDFHLIFSKIIEQREEFQMLHKIGVQIQQLVICFLGENGLPVVIAIILGNGIGVGWLYLDVSKDTGTIFPFSYLIPWRYIIAANIIIIIATVLAIVGIYFYIKGVNKNANCKRYNR